MRLEVVGCSDKCTLSKQRLGPNFDRVHAWFEEGLSYDRVITLAREHGVKLSQGSIGRHKTHHLRVWSDPGPSGDELPPMGDLEILELLIRRGAHGLNAPNSRVTPEMTLKAMELKYKLTGASAFDSFLDAVADAMSTDADAEAPAAPEPPAEVA